MVGEFDCFYSPEGASFDTKAAPPHLLGVKYSKCMAFLVEGNETLL